MTASRKAKRNLGVVDGEGQVTDADPVPGTPENAVLMVERLLRRLLEDSVNQLKDDVSELRRFFTHFYGPTIDADEVEEFITNFQNRPPQAKLGYARSGAEMPMFAIVLSEDSETDEFIGQYAGTEINEDGAFDFVGSFFDSTYSIYIYSEHPVQVAYLYQFVKAVIHSGKIALFTCGIQEVHLSGGELSPDEEYMPENMFVRVLRVKIKAPFTAPRFKLANPARIKVSGIFGNDVVVDGQKGGVSAIPLTVTPED